MWRWPLPGWGCTAACTGELTLTPTPTLPLALALTQALTQAVALSPTLILTLSLTLTLTLTLTLNLTRHPSRAMAELNNAYPNSIPASVQKNPRAAKGWRERFARYEDLVMPMLTLTRTPTPTPTPTPTRYDELVMPAQDAAGHAACLSPGSPVPRSPAQKEKPTRRRGARHARRPAVLVMPVLDVVLGGPPSLAMPALPEAEAVGETDAEAEVEVAEVEVAEVEMVDVEAAAVPPLRCTPSRTSRGERAWRGQALWLASLPAVEAGTATAGSLVAVPAPAQEAVGETEAEVEAEVEEAEVEVAEVEVEAVEGEAAEAEMEEAEMEKVPSDDAAAAAPPSDRQSRQRNAPQAIKGCAWPAAWCSLQAAQQAAEELRGVVEERELAAAGLEVMPQMPPPVRLRGLGLRGKTRGSVRLVLGSIEEGVLNSISDN